jgi:SAM-dependent methyltransferase
MGIDAQSLMLLGLARKRGCDFSEVLTVGRQSLQLEDRELILFLHSIRRPDLAANVGTIKGDGYCEGLMRAVFGAKHVESVDASDFERASIVHDMNFPLPGDRQFSVVLDFGCLEHIFNFPVAIENVIKSCKIDGHVIHALPSNNWCGHGFYQFSPELFFNLYSDRRGFRDTEVFLVELGRRAHWYRVRSTLDMKRRVNVINREKTYVFVLTRKFAAGISSIGTPLQQSDYVEKWNVADQAEDPFEARVVTDERQKGALKAGLSSFVKPLRLGLRRIRYRLIGYRERLHPGRNDMELFPVSDFVSGDSVGDRPGEGPRE